jgi:hypothetical protein
VSWGAGELGSWGAGEGRKPGARRQKVGGKKTYNEQPTTFNQQLNKLNELTKLIKTNNQ